MERCPELEDLVRAWFEAATRGDPSLIERHIADDPGTRLVGSDPDEWLQGGAAISAFLRSEVEGAGGNATFTPGETEAHAEGTVGWAATKLTIRLGDGRSISPRWTSVFHREDGRWCIVQTHASIAVPNDEVGWIYVEEAAGRSGH